MAGNSRILTVRIVSDASRVGVGLGEAEAKYGKFATALGTKSGSAGTAVGNSLVNGIDKTLGIGLKVVGAGGGLLLGTALFKGFNRLKDIDNATASLKGLGYSTQSVAKIMGNARAAVDDTKYALGDMAGVAGTMVAAGVEPGKQLESVLKGIADSAFIGKSSISDMGQIWGKVASNNKITGQEVNQLLDDQIPILKFLGRQYGVTAEQARDMVSKGQVDFANFAEAMETGLGGAALESGKTFEGAWDNAMAALGRIGAALLEPMFGPMTDGVNGFKDVLKSMEPVAANVGQAIADMGKWAKQNAGLLKALGVAGAIAIGVLLTFRTVVAVMSAYRAVLAVVKAFQIGYAAATYGTAAASYAGAAGTLAQNIALVAGKAVFLVVAGAQAVATAAQWAWNAAMAAGLGPVLIIIAIIALLVAGFILLWTKCEGFRNFWIGLWAGIQVVVAAVVAWFQSAWSAVLSWLTSYVQTSVAVFSAVWNGVKAVVAAVTGFFQSVWSAVLGWFRSYAQTSVAVFSAVWNGVRSVVSSVTNFFRSAWQGAVAVVNSVIRTMQGVFSSVFGSIMGPINAVSNALQSVIGWIRQVINWLSQIKIPDILGSIGNLFSGQGFAVAASYAGGPAPFAGRSGGGVVPYVLRALPTRAAAAGGGDVTVINVSGGLDSADTIARRIADLLEARGRRSAGVTVQRRTA